MILLLACGYLFPSYTIGQDSKSSRKADSLFNEGDYSHALIEYERCLFYGEGSYLYIDSLLLKKAWCYKQIKRLEEYLSTLNRIKPKFSDSSLFETVTYEKGLAYYLLEDYRNSELTLEPMNLDEVHFSTYLYLLALNEQGKWEQAREVFSRYASYHGVPDSLQGVYSFLETDNKRTQKLAKTLSYLIPGAGQFYIGEPRNGVNSLFTNSITGYLAINTIVSGYYIMGIVVLSPFYLRSYFGSQQNLRRIFTNRAMVFKEQKNDMLRKRILSINRRVKY